MPATKKRVLAICGSTRANSSNFQIVKAIAKLAKDDQDIEIYNGRDWLPHFNPDLDNENVSANVTEFKDQLIAADRFLICAPEYVFSLTGSLKNAIEWTVSATIFSNKPVAFITASSPEEKTYESLKLIFKTINARFDDRCQLLITGVKTKVNDHGEITDDLTLKKSNELIGASIKNNEWRISLK